MGYGDRVSIDEFIGKTLVSVKEAGSNEVYFEFIDGSKYKMFHEQDCCESVYLESVDVPLKHLIGMPILAASEETNSDNHLSGSDDSHTWTFYKIATFYTTCVMRWYGTSNGYYFESIDIERIS